MLQACPQGAIRALFAHEVASCARRRLESRGGDGVSLACRNRRRGLTVAALADSLSCFVRGSFSRFTSIVLLSFTCASSASRSCAVPYDRQLDQDEVRAICSLRRKTRACIRGAQCKAADYKNP